MVEFIEKEIKGDDLSEILALTPNDICMSLYEKYFFRDDPTKSPKFEVNDYFKLPTTKFNTNKEVWTTIGIYLMNLHLIQARFSKLFGYINKPFDGKTIGYIEDVLSNALYYDKISTNDMADYYNRLQWIGHDKFSLISPSITPALLKPAPGLMEKKAELLKKYEKKDYEEVIPNG